ncbi:hypothetical protein HMPREF9946_02214 [Acetobacteraceae bacterium AT-5844]|nr:hypothetical protein HMPREF9946_02214 [Acetobacteraceae bacterium AT-5844]
MSFPAIRWARSVRGISSTQKLVLMLLADTADESGEAWPSVDGLAADASLSDRAVQQALRDMAACGLLRVVAGGGRRRTSTYFLSMETVNVTTERAKDVHRKRNDVHPFQPEETVNVVPETVNLVPETVNVVRETVNDVRPNHQEPPRTIRNPQGGVGAQASLLPVEQSSREVDPMPAAVDAWNSICGSTNGRCSKLSDQRRTLLKARMAELGGIEGWVALCHRIAASPFLTGDNDRTWRADLDWCLKASNALKISEGKYDRRASAPKSDDSPWWADEMFGRNRDPREDDDFRGTIIEGEFH